MSHPPHIPLDNLSASSSRTFVSKHLAITIAISALCGFIASLLYAAYGPSPISHYETRVEKQPDGWDETVIRAAEESTLDLISDTGSNAPTAAQVKSVVAIDYASLTVGYGTAITSDGWFVTPVPGTKAAHALVTPRHADPYAKVVADPISGLFFVKVSSGALKILDQGSLSKLARGAKIAIVTPHTAFPVTLQDAHACISDRCPWEYADRLSYAATIVEQLPAHSVDGASVINASGALIGIATTAGNRVIIIPIEDIHDQLTGVFSHGAVSFNSLPIRALNITRWPALGTHWPLPEHGFAVANLPPQSGARYTTSINDLNEGDVITAIERETIEADSRLVDMLRPFQDRTSLQMDIIRAGKPLSIKVRLVPLTQVP